jgi:ComF family protein
LSNRATETFDCADELPRANEFVPARRAGSQWRTLRGRVMRVAQLALPQHCELCVANSGSGLLCAACVADLPRLSACCPVCALPSEDGARCGACLAHPPPWSRTTAALVYAFPVDRLLQQLKYGGRLALADWAGETLASAVRPSFTSRVPSDRPDRIVALPLATARQRERGFNQAREIAARVADAIALPLHSPLGRIAGAKPQAALAWKDRANNVRGAFRVDKDVRGGRIALIDDVMTTGATLAEAARVLIGAGAADVECWVVARTLRINDG